MEVPVALVVKANKEACPVAMEEDHQANKEDKQANKDQEESSKAKPRNCSQMLLVVVIAEEMAEVMVAKKTFAAVQSVASAASQFAHQNGANPTRVRDSAASTVPKT